MASDVDFNLLDGLPAQKLALRGEFLDPTLQHVSWRKWGSDIRRSEAADSDRKGCAEVAQDSSA
ncbi:hypothetical protein C4D60_Mb03t12210 [Musa balbisiana]|uniref:Uncharacterized protein n=1 Tax=Musa balbisiana TaxID=52838 RepID=A0A4S8JBS9_MUSBA|nr:hypothetical protein C4D60_Mb03t12210 [Musa balbisiana]